VSVQHLAAGFYSVHVDFDPRTCAVVATVDEPPLTTGDTAVNARNSNAGYDVATWGDDGLLTDYGFSTAVFC
jgi:hypothetical protein